LKAVQRTASTLSVIIKKGGHCFQCTAFSKGEG
jgi:hypothetical protein